MSAYLAGAVFAAIIAFAAFRAHALTRGGALAAFAVGTCTYGGGHWPFTLVLLAFFIPSVALSRFGRARKKRIVDVGKGGARDALQVAANGGVATLCAVLAGIDGGPWSAAFAGAYAAATADTWGTEIGTLMRARPRSILTLRPIAAGLSGGITLGGTLAECAGAIWIALVATLLIRLGIRDLAAIAVAGIAGALIDSVLGATLQELRRCPACDRTCETDPHACGTATYVVRGLRGFTNDGVNFLATYIGAAIAFVIASGG